jgi:uncharacterized protein involved in exopolysaccharide biosynthesis
MFVIPAAIVMAASVLITFLLPPIYESRSTILIETQDIPEDIVHSTVTGLIEERLQGLGQVVLNRKQLLDLINRFNLYPEERLVQNPSALVDKMRNDISVDMIQTEVNDPERARSGMATYAFSVAFEGKQPEKVLQVTNTLTSLYLEENIKNREEKAQSTYLYLEARIKEVEADMEDVQERIADFKARNKFLLPELQPINIRNLERLESQIAYREDEVRKKLEQIRYWQSTQSSTPKYITVRTTGGQRLITPEEELDRMRRDYVALTATRSADHPDAQNLLKEITALEEQVRQRQDIKTYQDELEATENELADAQEKYSNQHPDVLRLTRAVERLQNDVRTLEERYSIVAPKQDKEINPQWLHAKTELENKKLELVPLESNLKSLENQKDDLQGRIDESPQVELEYNGLLHELDTLKTAHDELLQRGLAAKEAKNLEESGLGEKFTLIDPPVLPESPAKPNRPLLLALGFIAALTFGTASGVVAEVLDRSVHTAQELALLSRLPVLAVVPYMESSADLPQKNKQASLKRLAILGIIVLALLLFHFMIIPLDVLIFNLIGMVTNLI